MSESITTISPITNQAILTRHGLVDSSFEQLAADSKNAFLEYYKSYSLQNRQEVVLKALELLDDLRHDLAKELTEQMGRPIAYTANEVVTAVARGQYLLKASTNALKNTEGEPENGFKRYIRKEPVGPVLIIIAWNYPYLILINSLIPALLAGNSVIIKPSPQTPTIAEHIQRIFEKSGLPQKVIQFLHCGSGERLEPLIRSEHVKLICFTGSIAGGLAVQRAAAGRVVPVALELGGKDPAYVRNDVDLNWAAAEIADGALFNSGQSCCSVERVYVDTSIHDSFVSALQDVLLTYTVGDPFDLKTKIGPVVSRRAAETIKAQVKDALDKGAKDATPDLPGLNFSVENPVGNYVAPVLLINVNHTMKVMTEETFGPVIAVMSVSSDDEAIRLMNDSEYGLTASIWTKNIARGEELAGLVDAGTVFVNRCDFPSPDLAWTGWKNSGRGVTLSPFGFNQFVQLKSFHVKSYPIGEV
ncbi:MAG: hypothetical protein M1829_004554 [Trizodia sp. TS-e1964]|nr:MAG: hypothetical protein M1829_004554 [Trizodia sp. TS-e1964]